MNEKTKERSLDVRHILKKGVLLRRSLGEKNDYSKEKRNDYSKGGFNCEEGCVSRKSNVERSTCVSKWLL